MGEIVEIEGDAGGSGGGVEHGASIERVGLLAVIFGF